MTTKYLRLTGLVLAATTAALMAQPAASAPEWEFELAPYLWAAAIDGDITLRGDNYSVSGDFEDVLDQTEFGGELLFEAVRGRWVSLAMIDYIVLENDDVSTRIGREDLKLELDSTLATVATGYRFSLGGERHSVDVMAGLRYAGFDLELDANRAGRISDDRNIYDGIVMLRPRMQLSDHWTLMPSVSVGGGDSDLTWELFPEIIYQPDRLRFRLGYRNLNYENEKGNDKIDFSMRGLLVGIGFTF